MILGVSKSQRRELHLDVNRQKEPLLLLDVSTWSVGKNESDYLHQNAAAENLKNIFTVKDDFLLTTK
jgi:hypothetical protein